MPVDCRVFVCLKWYTGIWIKCDLDTAFQIWPDQDSHSWPPDHDNTFRVTEMPALSTWSLVTSLNSRSNAGSQISGSPVTRVAENFGFGNDNNLIPHNYSSRWLKNWRKPIRVTKNYNSSCGPASVVIAVFGKWAYIFILSISLFKMFLYWIFGHFQSSSTQWKGTHKVM